MISSDSLLVEINEIFEKARPLDNVFPKLKEKAETLKSDPLYYAEFIKADFAVSISKAMEEKGFNKKTLAERLGLSRQYIGRVLNENANFTIETMAAFACALGKEIEIKLNDINAYYESVEQKFSVKIDSIPRELIDIRTCLALKTEPSKLWDPKKFNKRINDVRKKSIAA